MNIKVTETNAEYGTPADVDDPDEEDDNGMTNAVDAIILEDRTKQSEVDIGQEDLNNKHGSSVNKLDLTAEGSDSKSTLEDAVDGNGDSEREEADKTQAAPDGGWGWFVMLGCFLTHVIMGGFERSNGVLFLQLKSYFDQSATATSWAVSINSTLRLLMGPLASALCNRFTVRTVVTLGATLCALGVLISAFAPNLIFLYFSYGLLCGFGRAFAYGPSLIILGQYFNKRRSLAVGIATSGGGFAAFVFPSMFEGVFEHYGFSGAFLILSAVISHFYICAALFRPLHVHQRIELQDRLRKVKIQENSESFIEKDLRIRSRLVKIEDNEKSDDLTESSTDKRPFIRRTYLQFKRFVCGQTPNENKRKLLDVSLLKNFAFCCLCVQLFLFTLSFNTTFTYLPALALEKGIDKMHGAYLISVMGICDALSRIIVSVFLDMKRVRQYRLIIYNVTIFVISVISLAVPFMSTFWQFCIVSGLYGVACGLYISQKSVVCVDVLGAEHLTSSFGLLLAFQGAGSFVGPTIGGMLKDLLGSYGLAFFVGSAGTFVGGTVMASGNLWLHRHTKRSPETGQ